MDLTVIYLNMANEIVRLELDAQRYRKLKADRKGAMLRMGDEYISWENIDAAVDALPDPNANPDKSR